MKKALLLLLQLGVVASIATGCAVNRATAHVEPGTRLSEIKTVHVKKFASDNADTDRLIADKLRSKGVSATTGTAAPANKVDAVVTYVEKWMWDITMYMLELTVVIRDPKDDYPLATGNSYHTSLTRKSPKEMVDEVIDNIYKEQGQ
ncbi:MAG: hypothetical protein JNK97_07700 [Zoogloea sp.]|nr:hypothetical protein [Zoogloea sp.]